MMLTAALFVLAFVPMLVEARLSARNTAALLAAGAIEPRRDVYRVMQIAYPAAFLAIIAASRGRPFELDAIAVAGLVIFLLAKALKYWAIAALGRRWTFRVLVPPRSSRTSAGPYRLMRHPNYAAVLGELAGMALMAHARLAGIAAVLGFGALIVFRIRVEEAALQAAAE
jgi:methyltransferase